jgi:murein DD-endopeptidase MepM/ murein hydrolase activator NlpD
MQGLNTDRRHWKDHRRKQIRRRRVGALVILVTLTLLAVWLAYALPAATPARVPAAAAQPTFSEKVTVGSTAVVATVGDVELVLPVPLEATTAIGYHAVDNPDAVPFAPRGERAGGGGLAARVADIFADDGELPYYLLGGDGASSSGTAGLDIGAVPGAEVFSPADGKVVSVRHTTIAGKYEDVELQIQLADEPSLLLVVTHLARPGVDVGDTLTRGESLLGHVRAYPSAIRQELSTYTSDAGDHVQFVVLRVTPDIAGL